MTPYAARADAPAGGGDPLGERNITEFDALPGVELIEIYNATGSAIAIAGYRLIPAGTRLPVDGLLVVADEIAATGATNVHNADLIANGADFENSGGEAVQLLSSAGLVLDALGHNVNGALLTVAANATPRGATNW